MKTTQTKSKKEFGYFQKPLELSELMVDILKGLCFSPNIIVEPTCGVGNILIKAHNSFSPQKTIGIETNKEYCMALREKLNGKQNLSILNRDIFIYFDRIKDEIKPNEVCLFIGNPPWVTNSELGSMDSKNIPVKTNLKNLRGIDAITGKSNFDISEFIIIKLIEEFNCNKSIFAFLCKTSVARNILKYCWQNRIHYHDAFIFPIDSKKYFNAAVDACYFIIDASKKGIKKECIVYDSIENRLYKNKIGFYQERLIGNIDSFLSYNYLGKSDYIWRNGIKHDCSKVMEFDIAGSKLINGYGEEADIEDDLVYPLLKSSDIANGKIKVRKKVLVTQKQVGEETNYIKDKYPKTWKYLHGYIEDFNKRKSCIYKNKPLFSIFSIGEYCFYPYKVAISGLYKHLNFKIIYPAGEKPVLVDDTCNFISCNTEAEASMLYSLLENEETKNFLNSIIFWDSKRPITTEILNSIDLKKIANEKSLQNHYNILLDYNKTTNSGKYMQMDLL
jgi:hypothetical protein